MVIESPRLHIFNAPLGMAEMGKFINRLVILSDRQGVEESSHDRYSQVAVWPEDPSTACVPHSAQDDNVATVLFLNAKCRMLITYQR